MKYWCTWKILIADIQGNKHSKPGFSFKATSYMQDVCTITNNKVFYSGDLNSKYWQQKLPPYGILYKSTLLI